MVQWIVFVRCADIVVVEDNKFSPMLIHLRATTFLAA
jgi:hypothetical protein